MEVPERLDGGGVGWRVVGLDGWMEQVPARQGLDKRLDGLDGWMEGVWGWMGWREGAGRGWGGRLDGGGWLAGLAGWRGPGWSGWRGPGGTEGAWMEGGLETGWRGPDWMDEGGRAGAWCGWKVFERGREPDGGMDGVVLRFGSRGSCRVSVQRFAVFCGSQG